MENNWLKNKVILITGAGSGFGRAISLRFAAKGASLVIYNKKSQTLDKIIKLINS